MSRFGAALTVSLLLAPNTAFAGEKWACGDAHVEGQKLRKEGKLVAARAQLASCAADTCPEMIRGECSALVADIDQSLPTVVLAAHDEKGNDVIAAKLAIDARPLDATMAGRAVPVDPGVHTFSAEGSDGVRVEQKLLVKEGEKKRIVVLTLSAKPGDSKPPPPPEPTPKRATPIAPYIFGGFGIAALGVFGYFGARALGDRSDLQSTCAPTCDESRVDAIRTKYLVSEIALGVSVVSLGVAAYLFVTAPKDARETKNTVSIAPLPGGVGLRWSSEF